MANNNPPRVYEPLPSGPYTGKEILWAVGWDEDGIQKSGMLKQLGLEEVDRI